MKQKNDPVFSLIKRMTKGEKRYFQLVNTKYSGGKQTKHMQLYNFIDKSTDPKDIEIQSKIKNYRVVKNQLYKLIIETLTTYHLKNNEFCTIDRMVLKAKVLLKKNMYEECLHFITKTKPVLLEQERYLVLVKLYELEDTALLYSKPYDSYFSEESNKITTVTELFKKYYNFLEARATFKKAGEILPKVDLNRITDYQTTKNEFLSYLEDLEKGALSKRALRYIYKSRVYFHLTFNELTIARDYQIKIKNLTHEMYAIGTLTVEYPAFTIINLTAMELKMGINEGEVRFEEFKKLESQVHGMKEKDLCYLGKTYCQVLYLWGSEDIPAILKIYSKIPKEILQEIGKIEPRLELDLFYMIALSHFFNENYAEASDLVSLLIEEISPHSNIHIYTSCLILNLLIHFEIGNYQFLEGLGKSTKRKIKRMHKLDALNDKLLNFFSNKLQKTALTEFPKSFEKLISTSTLNEALISISSISSSYNLIYYWMNAKAKNLKLKAYIQGEIKLHDYSN